MEAILPEFVPLPPPLVDNFDPVELPLPAQPAYLDPSVLAEAWEDGRARLAILHRATFEGHWGEVWEGTRGGVAHARRVLGRGGDEEE